MALPPAITTSSLPTLEDWSNDPDFDFPLESSSGQRLSLRSPSPSQHARFGGEGGGSGGMGDEDEDADGFDDDAEGFGEVEDDSADRRMMMSIDQGIIRRGVSGSGPVLGSTSRTISGQGHVAKTGTGTITKLTRKSSKSILPTIPPPLRNAATRPNNNNIKEEDDDEDDGFGFSDPELPLSGSGTGTASNLASGTMSRKISQPQFRTTSRTLAGETTLRPHAQTAQPQTKQSGPNLITKESFANLNLNKIQQARLNTRPEGYGTGAVAGGGRTSSSSGGGGYGAGIGSGVVVGPGDEGEDWGDEFGMDEHDEKEETLKPGRAGLGTISGGGTISSGRSAGGTIKFVSTTATQEKERERENYDDDLDFDFPTDDDDGKGTNTLPLTFSHLKLVNRQMSNTPHHRYHHTGQPSGSGSGSGSGFGQEAALRHRSSRSSLLSTNTNPTSSSMSDWDSPTRQAKVGGSQAHGGEGHGQKGQRRDWDRVASPTTTATSLTTSASLGGGMTDSSFGGESIKTPNMKTKHGDGMRPLLTPGSSSDSLDVVDDFEDGLEIPSGKLTFFSSGRVGVGELNRLLDKKRKSGFVPGPNVAGGTHRRAAEQDARVVSNTSVASSELGGADSQDRKQSYSSGTFKASRPTIASQAKAQSYYGKSGNRDRDKEEDFEDGLGLDGDEDAGPGFAGTLLNKGRLMTVKKSRGAGSTPPPSRTNAANAQAPASRSRTGSRLTIARSEVHAGLPALRVSSGHGTSDVAHGDSGVATAQYNAPPGLPPGGLSTIQASPPAGSTGVATLCVATPSRLRHQASYSRLQPGTSHAGAPGHAAQSVSSGSSSALRKKQSMSALSAGPDPFTVQDRPRTPSLVSSKHYVAPTASSVARQQAQKKDRTDKEREKEKGDSIGRTSSAGGSSIGHSAGSFGHSSRPDTPNEHSPTSRLTLPTTSSKAKARPAIHSIFPSGESQVVSPPRATAPAAQMLRKPKHARLYGDGTELDAIDDLTVDRAKEGMMRQSSNGLRPVTEDSKTLGTNAAPNLRPQLAGEKRKKPTSSSSATNATKTKPRKAAGLIRHLGRMEQKKVGDMTWNPQTLRWEGNYGVLRDFENHTASSARPALITQYNSGSTLPASPAGLSIGSKPLATVASSVRVVGDMRFDPIKMCWISNLKPEEDEPDPFDEMDAELEARDEFGDDEDDDGRGGTITKGMAQNALGAGANRGAGVVEGMKRWVSASSVSASSTTTSTSSRHNTPNPQRNSPQHFSTPDLTTTPYYGHASQPKRHPASSGLSSELLAECREADRRHRAQFSAFHGSDGIAALDSRRPGGREDKKEKDRRDRKEEKRLWEVRHLAMRS